MIITENIATHIARLSGIRLAGDETAAMTRDLGAIVGYMETLSRLDTSGVEPLAHIQPRWNHMRPDDRKPSADRAELIRNASRHNEEFVVAPRTFGEGGGA